MNMRILSLSLLLLIVIFTNGTAKAVKNNAIVNISINMYNAIGVFKERFAIIMNNIKQNKKNRRRQITKNNE